MLKLGTIMLVVSVLAAGNVHADTGAAGETAGGKSPFFPRLQSPLRLVERIEALPPGPEEPYDYERTLPFFGRELAAKGYGFPLPFGISLLVNDTLQPQRITDAAVALGKGMTPQPGTELRELLHQPNGEKK